MATGHGANGLLVTFVGEAARLDRLVFLYEKFLLFASFALAVVFQPELRRALVDEIDGFIGQEPVRNIPVG